MISVRKREVVAGYTKEYINMKVDGTDNSLLFVTLADLPPIPKPIPQTECPDVTFWSKEDYRKFLKTQNQQAGATEGDKEGDDADTEVGEEQGRRCHHLYLQNRDGTPT